MINNYTLFKSLGIGLMIGGIILIFPKPYLILNSIMTFIGTILYIIFDDLQFKKSKENNETK